MGKNGSWKVDNRERLARTSKRKSDNSKKKNKYKRVKRARKMEREIGQERDKERERERKGKRERERPLKVVCHDQMNESLTFNDIEGRRKELQN